MIDWDKPIECDHGELRIAQGFGVSTGVAVALDGAVFWIVEKETGAPFSDAVGDPWDSFLVRNKISMRDKAIAVIERKFALTVGPSKIVDVLIANGLLKDD